MDWSIPIVVDDILFNPHLRWLNSNSSLVKHGAFSLVKAPLSHGYQPEVSGSMSCSGLILWGDRHHFLGKKKWSIWGDYGYIPWIFFLP